MLSERELTNAKNRIWNSIEGRLVARGISAYAPTLNWVRSGLPNLSRLKKVQMKESIVDFLPDRQPPLQFFSKRLLSVSTLLFVLSVLFMPVFHSLPLASASEYSLLEVEKGELWLNGELVQGTAWLQEGDFIETGDQSLAHLYLVDDSRVTLGPLTTLALTRVQVDPVNRANSEIRLQQETGELWVQVLNLVSKDAYLALDFPEGEVWVNNRASFTVRVGDVESEVAVARNVVDVQFETKSYSHGGLLSQGTSAYVGDELQFEESNVEEAWFTYNLAFGQDYERQLDEQYKKENIERGIILPGNPLYVLKTFRESLQVSLTFSSEAKKQLLVEQAKARLTEAQVLLTQGETQAAEEVLKVYEKTVNETLQGSDNPALLAVLEEKQKELSVSQDVSGMSALEAQLSKTSALLPSELEGKTEVKILSATQKLHRVPDLLANGDYEEAIAYLSVYQSESLSLMSELQQVPMDQREGVVASLLEQKLRDIQILRVLAAMPELSSLDLNGQLLQQMSFLVLSLRERELSGLAEFFEDTDFEAGLQQELYARLKEQVNITPKLTQQLENVEDEISTVTSSETPVGSMVEELVTPVDDLAGEAPVVDPRFE